MMSRWVSAKPHRASDFSSVDTVTAAGPYTVVIKLKTRFTPLTATLATVDGVVLSPTQLASNAPAARVSTMRNTSPV